MTESTKKGQKIQRARKRVYEAVEPAKVSEMSAAAAETFIEESILPPLVSKVEALEPPAEIIVHPETDKEKSALNIVRNYTLCSAGAGVVPIPLLDMAAMMTLQMLMVHKLAKHYGIPYKEQQSKAAVSGLIGGVSAGYLGGGAFIKMIPLFGIFSYAAMPAINAAISYAVGKVFIQHFEAGGTFLDFDPKKVRAYFEDQFREGKLKTT